MFLWRQIKWFGISISKNFPQFCVIHPFKGFLIANEEELDAFQNSLFFFFFYFPVAVGNLISGFTAFSESSLYIWKFLAYVLLKPSLKNFEHYLASM